MISEIDYKKRRDKIAKSLQPYSVAVIKSAKYQTRSNDTEYPFRQNSNFYYLCGFKEDNASLVFVKLKTKVKVFLFVQKKDEALELWTGKRLGVKEAKKSFLVDKVYDSEDFKKVYKKVVKFAKKVKLEKKIETLRLIKSSKEIKLIKKAISITKEAHHRAMSVAKESKKEYELQAEIEYIFKKNGAYSDAYTSIVACGNSANTLHYIKNDDTLKKDELILIDAGCEYEYYASDITRTIPVSGKFTKPQKELYEMILDVQLKIISSIKPHAKRTDLQKQAEELLCRGLVKLGILQGEVKQLLKDEKHKKYYPHGIGHWMGLDVHDQAPYKDKKNKEIPLACGMVLTIEPGIYIDKDDVDAPKKYRGIGIRIEDDILVSKDGCENLSSDIAKSVKEIEDKYKGIN